MRYAVTKPFSILVPIFRKRAQRDSQHPKADLLSIFIDDDRRVGDNEFNTTRGSRTIPRP